MFTEDNEDEAGLPRQQRRQELAGRRVQPADQRDVHAAAEHVHERHDDGGHARSVEGLRPRHAGRARAGRRQRRHRVGDLGRDRHRRCGSTSSARACSRSSPPAAASCSAATRTAASRRSTTRPARCCGRSISARPVSGYPISFAVAGKQYVAAIIGPSLEANSTRGLTPELKTGIGPNIFVFALP